MGYPVRDQTRQGTSNGGKEAGEVDILVRKEGFPFSIIEALNLSSISEAYDFKWGESVCQMTL